jgi:hypothetical protein
MNALSSTSNQLLQVALVLAVAVGSFILDGILAAYLWAQGVNLATIDVPVKPGESGFHIEPLTAIYKWLLIALFVTNACILVYLLAKRQLWYALSFVVGAALPMLFLINSLGSV